MNLNSLIVKLPSRTGQLTSCFSQPCKLMSQGETNLNISCVSSFFFLQWSRKLGGREHDAIIIQ